MNEDGHRVLVRLKREDGSDSLLPVIAPCGVGQRTGNHICLITHAVIEEMMEKGELADDFDDFIIESINDVLLSDTTDMNLKRSW